VIFYPGTYLKVCVNLSLPGKLKRRRLRMKGLIMRKKEKNVLIIAQIREQINQQGLSGILDVYPVESTCTSRPRHWEDSNGKHLFKVLMWTVNELDSENLVKTINMRIAEARRHFNI